MEVEEGDVLTEDDDGDLERMLKSLEEDKNFVQESLELANREKASGKKLLRGSGSSKSGSAGSAEGRLVEMANRVAELESKLKGSHDDFLEKRIKDLEDVIASLKDSAASGESSSYSSSSSSSSSSGSPGSPGSPGGGSAASSQDAALEQTCPPVRRTLSLSWGFFPLVVARWFPLGSSDLLPNFLFLDAG